MYAPARSVRAAPRGMEERTTIGGRAMLPTSAVHALGPAAALAWADDGSALTILVFASWWMFLEIQRRSRAVLEGDAWTSRPLDRLENNYEIVAVSALWALAGSLYAAASPDAIPQLMDYVVGVLILGICGTSARAACSVIATRWHVGLLAVVASLATVATWSLHLWVPFGVVPAVLWFAGVQRARRDERTRLAAQIKREAPPDEFERRYPRLNAAG